MKKLLIAVTMALVLALLSNVLAFAKGGGGKVTICHAAGLAGTDKYIELNLSWNAVFGQAGHFYENGTPRAGHEEDYLGPCGGDPEPTKETPTPVTPTSVTPESSQTPVPSATPIPSGTPEPECEVNLNGSEPGCGEPEIITVTPIPSGTPPVQCVVDYNGEKPGCGQPPITPEVTETPPTDDVITSTPVVTETPPVVIETPKARYVQPCKAAQPCGSRREEVPQTKFEVVQSLYTEGPCSSPDRPECYTAENLVGRAFLGSENFFFLDTSADETKLLAELLAGNTGTAEMRATYDIVEIKGKLYVAPVTRVTPNGIEFALDMPSRKLGGDWEILTLDANGNIGKYRDVYGQNSVQKNISCSRSVYWWDFDSTGKAIKGELGGPVDYDWIVFMQENFDYTPDEAYDWMIQLYEDGSNVLPVE